MASDVPPARESHLDWLLAGLVDRVRHTRSVVLLSADGLTRSACGLDSDSADHLAAIACGLFSVARTAAATFGNGEGGVRQVLAELDDTTLLFVYSAGSGSGSVLAVLAGRDADAAVLGYEMTQLAKSVAPFLATPARGAVAHGPVGHT